MIERFLSHFLQFVCVRQVLVGADALDASPTDLLDDSRISLLGLDRGGCLLAASILALDILRCSEGLSTRTTLYALAADRP